MVRDFIIIKRDVIDIERKLYLINHRNVMDFVGRKKGNN